MFFQGSFFTDFKGFMGVVSFDGGHRALVYLVKGGVYRQVYICVITIVPRKS